MRAAKIDISNDTKFSILKGLSRYSSQNDFQKALDVYNIQLNDDQLIEIIRELGLYNVTWLSEVSLLIMIRIINSNNNFSATCATRYKEQRK